MISAGVITKRANDEEMDARVIERDYILSDICADMGALDEPRLVFKGGTLLRLCYFDDYRYSADLDFSAINGLSKGDALGRIASALANCQQRLELSELGLVDDGEALAISFVGPVGARSRRIKLDVSDTELVENHQRVPLQHLWSDLPDDAALEGYALEEVGAEKLRCIADRVQCRDLFDIHHLLDAQLIEPMESWELYLRKAENDKVNGKQRTSPGQWAHMFGRRLGAYQRSWTQELGEYMSDVPPFDTVERQTSRLLRPVVAAAGNLRE